jgi:hypothetical protein
VWQPFQHQQLLVNIVQQIRVGELPQTKIDRHGHQPQAVALPTMFCAQASLFTQRPIGTIRPASPASGMNCAVGTTPGSGRIKRLDPIIWPLANLQLIQSSAYSAAKPALAHPGKGAIKRQRSIA